MTEDPINLQNLRSYSAIAHIYVGTEPAEDDPAMRKCCRELYTRSLKGSEILEVGCGPGVDAYYLVPEARYLGVGKAMLAALEEAARARGLTALELYSTKTAHAFYKRNGYVDTGKSVAMFGLESQDMHKELTNPN